MAYTDNFDRADNSDLGANWTPVVNSFKILSNKATPVSGSVDAVETYSGGTFGNDQYVQAAVDTLSNEGGSGGGVGIGLIIRYDGTNYYRIVVCTATTDNVEVARYNPTYTQIANRTQAFSDGDTLRVEMQGSTMRLYHNGTQMGGDITDTQITSGKPGVGFSGVSTGNLNNWEGGDLGGGTNATVTAAVATSTASSVAPPKPRPANPFAEINVRM